MNKATYIKGMNIYQHQMHLIDTKYEKAEWSNTFIWVIFELSFKKKKRGQIYPSSLTPKQTRGVHIHALFLPYMRGVLRDNSAMPVSTKTAYCKRIVCQQYQFS